MSGTGEDQDTGAGYLSRQSGEYLSLVEIRHIIASPYLPLILRAPLSHSCSLRTVPLLLKREPLLLEQLQASIYCVWVIKDAPLPCNLL